MRPPGEGLARAVLRVMGGSSTTAARILDDLAEEWRDGVTGRTGRLGAGLWFWNQVLRSVPPLLRRRSERLTARVRRTAGWTNDLRSAVRGLARSPGFSAAAAAILALGIGANTALFSVVQAVVLAPLPYASPERIHRAWAGNHALGIDRFSFRVAEHDRLQGRPTFSAVGGEFPVAVTVMADDETPARVDARMVTPTFFEVFGVTPALGRMFDAAEVGAGDRRLVVVSHAFWRDRLGSDRSALGRGVSIDGNRYEVVGVLPAGYVHVSDPGVDLFLPHTVGTAGWTGRWLDLYLRLAPGVEADAASADLAGVLTGLAEAGDTRSRGWTADLEPLDTVVLGDVRPLVWLLFAAVSLLLLVACVSVAGLVLARSTTRLEEFRIRDALGAGRGRLVRLLLLESLVLAAAGGLAGVVVAHVGLDALLALVPQDVPRLDDVSLDGRVLAFTAVVAAAAGLLFGLVPAVGGSAFSASGPPGLSARGGTADRRTAGLLRALVVTQVALTLALTTGAGLLVRSVANLGDRELGFHGPALTYRIALPASGYPSATEIQAFLARYVDALEAVPGVTAAGAAADLPLSGQGAVASVRTETDVQAGADDGRAVLQRRAAPGFFGALGVPVLAGRVFDGSEDPAGNAVVVVSRTLADGMFPGESAVGRHITFRRAPAEADWLTIVGVVEDVEYVAMDGDARPQLYEALAQSPVRDLAMVMRGDLPRRTALAAATATLAAIDPTVPIHAVHTVDELRDRALARRHFALVLFSLFAAAATVLTGAGLYGVLALAVRRRSREIGVRLALGARRSTVVGGVVRDAAGLAGLGIAGGLGLAWVSGGVSTRLLYGVTPLDPAVLATTAATTLILALVAAWAPARRAASVDPGQTLRGG